MSGLGVALCHVTFSCIVNRQPQIWSTVQNTIFENLNIQVKGRMNYLNLRSCSSGTLGGSQRYPPKQASTFHCEQLRIGGSHYSRGPNWRVPLLGRFTLEGTSTQEVHIGGYLYSGGLHWRVPLRNCEDSSKMILNLFVIQKTILKR